MKFNKVLNELKISVLAQQLKNNNPIFDKPDVEITKAIQTLVDDSGKLITNLDLAKQYIKKMGLNPDDQKISKILTSAIQRNLQQQQANQDNQKLAHDRAQEINARKGIINNQIKAKGWIS